MNLDHEDQFEEKIYSILLENAKLETNIYY